jgi:hypothetical protein
MNLHFLVNEILTMRNFVMHETGRIGVEICPAYLLHQHNTMKSSWRFEKHAENGQEK